MTPHAGRREVSEHDARIKGDHPGIPTPNVSSTGKLLNSDA
jgi:hypothetical protein